MKKQLSLKALAATAALIGASIGLVAGVIVPSPFESHDQSLDTPIVATESAQMVRAIDLGDALEQCNEVMKGAMVEDCIDAAMESWCVTSPMPTLSPECKQGYAPEWAKSLALKQMTELSMGDCRVNITETTGVCATYLDDTLYYVMFSDGVTVKVTK